MPEPTIIYTHTDEAPALATYSLLPIVRAYAVDGRGQPSRPATSRSPAASSPASPSASSRTSASATHLAELGELAKTPDANIIKLPNISASIPQLKAAIAELQQQGYALPDYPGRPADRRGAGRPRALRPGHGQRRESGAARGQLGPPRAGVGQELREGAPALAWARGPRIRRRTWRT